MASIIQIAAVQWALPANSECKRDLDSKLQRRYGPLNTRRAHAVCGVVSLRIAPSRSNDCAGDFSVPRRTAAENYLDPSVLVGSVTESPKKQLRRATARRSAVNGSFRAWRHDVKVQACRANLEPLAGSRSSRTERGLNHRAIWLGGVWHQSANTDTSRPIRWLWFPFDALLTSHCLGFVGLGGLCKAVFLLPQSGGVVYEQQE